MAPSIGTGFKFSGWYLATAQILSKPLQGGPSKQETVQEAIPTFWTEAIQTIQDIEIGAQKSRGPKKNVCWISGRNAQIISNNFTWANGTQR